MTVIIERQGLKEILANVKEIQPLTTQNEVNKITGYKLITKDGREIVISPKDKMRLE